MHYRPIRTATFGLSHIRIHNELDKHVEIPKKNHTNYFSLDRSLFYYFGDNAYQQLLCNMLNEFIIEEKNPDKKSCIYILC